MSDLDKINSIFNAKIDSIKSKDDLQNLKTEFFGRAKKNVKRTRSDFFPNFQILKFPYFQNPKLGIPPNPYYPY